jgi:murein L,D-transpeptidase YcbB/YkuD
VASFNLNDTIGMMMRVLTHHREIIDWWHKTAALLQKIGLLPAGAEPAHASHPFDVRWVQSSLNTLSNAGLDVDGVMGVRTVAAVTNFQRDNKLTPDGWIGVLTLAKLEEKMQGRNG